MWCVLTRELQWIYQKPYTIVEKGEEKRSTTSHPHHTLTKTWPSSFPHTSVTPKQNCIDKHVYMKPEALSKAEMLQGLTRAIHSQYVAFRRESGNPYTSTTPPPRPQKPPPQPHHTFAGVGSAAQVNVLGFIFA